MAECVYLEGHAPKETRVTNCKRQHPAGTRRCNRNFTTVTKDRRYRGEDLIQRVRWIVFERGVATRDQLDGARVNYLTYQSMRAQAIIADEEQQVASRWLGGPERANQQFVARP